MLNVVLFEPEIPQNTGNISRTCAVTGTRLHLIKPLGFDISEKAVKRAGLDYWDFLDLCVYDDLESFFKKNGDNKLWLATTKANSLYTDAVYSDDCFLMFGKETAGLPEKLLQSYSERCIRIPMLGGVRSLNLSNSVAIVLYEALRQTGFQGLR